jgi:hypothetical protein
MRPHGAGWKLRWTVRKWEGNKPLRIYIRTMPNGSWERFAICEDEWEHTDSRHTRLGGSD